MADRPVPATWSDHDVSDPGITLLQVLAVAVGAVAVVAASVALSRRRRRSGDAATAGTAPPTGSILDRLKAVVRPLLKRVLG